MADEAEDVLELDTELEEDGEEQPADGEPDGEDDEADEGESIFAFEGDEEEAAPASESESSVIRELRRANREQARRLADLERGNTPPKIEVGEKPTLESLDYDEVRYEAAYDEWKARKADADRAHHEQQQAAEKEREVWQKRADAYEASKAKLNISDYADAEGEVFSVLGEQTQALIMLTDKPAAMIYALSRNPAKLEELSKLNLARAAMTIGKLEDKLQMKKRNSLPDPDRPVRGNAMPASGDKQLAKLEKEADRTGDRTALIRYRKKLSAKA